MSASQSFVFDDEQPHAIRVIERDGEPWFVAKDVCAVLTIKDVSDAVEPLDDDEKGRDLTPTLGGEQEMLIVSEGGLYTLILRSRQATTPGSMAHRFRRWVTSELLPQIRKTGRYAADPGDDLDWQTINARIQLVREARLTSGRKAAAGLWKALGLPDIETPAAATTPRTPALNGVDFVRQFLEDCTEPDRNATVQARVLASRYKVWAMTHDATDMTERALAMCLEAIGVAKRRGHLHAYLGIRLKHQSEHTG